MLAFVGLFLLVARALATWQNPLPFPKTTINLDLPPEDRYTALINQIVKTHGWEYSYASVENYWDNLPTAIQSYMELISSNLEAYLPEEYVRELVGVEKVFISLGHGDDFPLSELLALNLMYEWTAHCTSMIVEDGMGNMWHARNMDWNFGGNSLFNISYIVDFQANGSTVYTGVQWVGYLGILSGANPWFTVTVDQRATPEPDSIFGNLDALEAGAQTIGFELREVLAKAKSFNNALVDLASSYIAAPVYYNMGGAQTGQGVVITRYREGNHTNLWNWASGPQPCCPNIQNWYLVETNWDHWTTQGDTRQTTAINALNALGQNNINATTLFQVLATPPVLNSNTQYSMVHLNGQAYFQVEGWQ